MPPPELFCRSDQTRTLVPRHRNSGAPTFLRKCPICQSGTFGAPEVWCLGTRVLVPLQEYKKFFVLISKTSIRIIVIIHCREEGFVGKYRCVFSNSSRLEAFFFHWECIGNYTPNSRVVLTIYNFNTHRPYKKE